ncbi:COBRA-like protein 9, partial [Bienertia sinuspersici]
RAASPNLNLTGSDPNQQPYSFESRLYIQNNGLQELKSWRAFVGFQNGELLVSASNAVLLDGSPLPSNVSNGTVFSGYPVADLKTAVQTAGDLSQMSVQVELVGTEFGVPPQQFPMPSNISLANHGFLCPTLNMQGDSSMSTCCRQDPDATSTTNATEQFLPRQNGDLSIIFDLAMDEKRVHLCYERLSKWVDFKDHPFNWEDTNFPNWFVAAELNEAIDGLTRVYSFNGSALQGNNNDNSSLVFMHGYPSENDYLLGQVNGSNPRKDPKLPGTLQSVILFDKKRTPGINVARGDGFPTKIIFNGEECSLPTTLPISSANTMVYNNLLLLVTLALMCITSMMV